MTTQITTTMFDVPSGNVRGIVCAFCQIKGEEKRIAHTTLTIGEEPKVTVTVPGRLTLAEVLDVNDALKQFHEKVVQLK